MHKKQRGPVIVSLLLVVAGIITLAAMNNIWQPNTISVNNPVINKVESNTQSLDLKSIIHKAEKSVVQIEGQNEQSTVTGSGFLYNGQGDIITNAHVVKDADVINVRTANGHIYPGAVIGAGENTDVAVIRVPQLADQSTLNIDAEKQAETGDEVIALGSPHGFQNTVTLGIISGTERNFSVDGFSYENAYQISAQITDGNSGGPLINRETGNVIGINAVGTNDGTIGFSIPVDDVYKQITRWSNEAQNDQLDFKYTDDITGSTNPDQLIEDAEYVAEYFFESISIRDYVGAYTLLGSNMQSANSYADFREGYIYYMDLEYSDLSSTVTEDNQIKTTVAVSAKAKTPEQEETKEHDITYELTIGQENDQLKILKINESNES
ncbi:Trypsin-like peptidase domain-containing protein [Lentibacillus halodurans]|uniref:Trypsin-like peptidase domain-containing protein n=1 Tax=Lentibacillus halodurans TaxID=237679 RepID=A0A1I1AFM3_9BACI|nr:trypsin-like peptidase domain-containing protein [Lentibacillus halodurans]SFB35280.1 Trypsin-like peptidase domain-containing protein [Lentibacillus halodurans]